MVEGQYRWADQAYAKLLEKLDDQKDDISQDLKANVLSFYRDETAIPDGKAKREWQRLQK